MKNLLDVLRGKSANQANDDAPESVFFATAFADHGISAEEAIPWEARAVEIGAKRFPSEKGGALMRSLWVKDHHMKHLQGQAMDHLVHFFDFALVPSQRDVMRQDEYGSFMVVLLNGSMAVERNQPWGERLRLSEAKPGEVLGEMSLLDGGKRFSDCTTIDECHMAVLSAQALDEMIVQAPHLSAALIGLLARKLSLRLRAMGAKLSYQQRG